jgi:hypothetical protein
MKRVLIFLLILAVSGCLGGETKEVEFLTNFTVSEQGCVKSVSGQRCREILYFTYEDKIYNKTLGWIITDDCKTRCGYGISDQTLKCMENCNRENREKPKPSDQLKLSGGKVRIKGIYNLTSKTLSNIEVAG